MVTKQEQLEWLAKAWESWSPYERGYVMMSSLFLGDFCSRQDLFGHVVHEITREDWQKKRDKLTNKQIAEQEVKQQDQYNFQEWCKSILGFVQAEAEGKEIEYRHNGSEIWWDFNNAVYDCISFTTIEEYRIKPKTIKVNGFDIPEPLNQGTGCGNSFYIACPTMDTLFIQHNAVLSSDLWFKRGLVHSTKEAAITHAKAMLGIDPNKE